MRSSDEGYYEDSITLLCLLVTTGNYWTSSSFGVPVPALGPAGAWLLGTLLLGAATRNLSHEKRG